MVKLVAREGLLILITGLFGMYAVPALMGQPPAAGLFSIVLVMALAYAAMYAMSVLAGNKMPARVRHSLGLIGWVGAFVPDLILMAQLAGRGAKFPTLGLYNWFAPALYGLLLTVLGTAMAPSGERGGVALSTLYAYSFPMLGVRWLLLPLVGGSPLGAALVLQTGAIYTTCRVLVRIFWPGSAGDSSAAPPVRRPVPDAIVGLVEGTTHRRALPYATLPGGALDDSAISVLVRPEEMHDVVQQLESALQDKPFRVFAGEAVAGGQVEVVVRSES